jgi:hypothetical protein
MPVVRWSMSKPVPAAPKAPRSKRLDEEVTKLRSKLNKLQYKKYEAEILGYLRLYPDLGPSTLEHLKDIAGGRPAPLATGMHEEDEVMLKALKDEGANEDGDEETDLDDENTAKPVGISPSKMGNGSAASSSKDTLQRSASKEEGGLDLRVPRCFTTVMAIPPKHLFEIIGELGEISLSRNSMRAICKRGAKLPAKDKLSEIFEFISGLSPEDSFPPMYHDINAFSKLCSMRMDVYKRPCRDMVLPPSWRQDGFYEIVINGACAAVRHKFLGIEFPLSASFLQKIDDLRGLHVDNNFSEQRARIVDVNGLVSMQVLIACPTLIEQLVSLDVMYAQSKREMKTEQDEALAAVVPTNDPLDAVGGGPKDLEATEEEEESQTAAPEEEAVKNEEIVTPKKMPKGVPPVAKSSLARRVECAAPPPPKKTRK